MDTVNIAKNIIEELHNIANVPHDGYSHDKKLEIVIRLIYKTIDKYKLLLSETTENPIEKDLIK